MVKMIFKSGYITRKGRQREGIEKKKTKEKGLKNKLLKKNS